MTPEQFWQILHAMPEPKPVFWRLYYNEAGQPIYYSMEDLPGNYIDIDAETFALAPANVRVVNGRLRYITQRTAEKLRPSITGSLCHPQNVAVIVTEHGTHWSKQTHGLEAD